MSHTNTVYNIYTFTVCFILFLRYKLLNLLIGSLTNPKPTFIQNENTIGEAVPLGEQKYAELSEEDFTQMKECWAVEYQSFRSVLTAYTHFERKHHQENARQRLRIRPRMTPVPSMAEWVPKESLRFTEKQLSMCKISPVIKVYT